MTTNRNSIRRAIVIVETTDGVGTLIDYQDPYATCTLSRDCSYLDDLFDPFERIDPPPPRWTTELEGYAQVTMVRNINDLFDQTRHNARPDGTPTIAARRELNPGGEA